MLKHNKSIIFILGIFCADTSFAYNNDDPSFELGISTAYSPLKFEQSSQNLGYYVVLPNNSVVDRPTALNNYQKISSNLTTTISGKVNIPSGDLSLGLGVDAQHTEDKVNESVNSSNISTNSLSGYKQTLASIDATYKIDQASFISVFVSAPVHYNETDFGKKVDFITYGGAFQWMDSQNFGIQLEASNTHIKDLEISNSQTVQIGDTLRASARFKFGFSQKAELYLGANHTRKQNDTELTRGNKTGEYGETEGTGALFGVNYVPDYTRHHHFNFEATTGVGEVSGFISAGYRYVFN